MLLHLSVPFNFMGYTCKRDRDSDEILLRPSFMTTKQTMCDIESDTWHIDQEIQQSLVDMGFMTNVLRSKTPLVQDKPDARG